MSYYVYFIESTNGSTYIGATVNLDKRIRQHNKEIKGGARYTSKRDSWYPVLIIDGFQDMKSAMQCEWRLKRGKKGAEGRIRYLNDYISNNDKWTSKSDLIINQNLTYYIDNDYKNRLSCDTKELYWK